jgi:molecular chaperone GrpE
MDKMEERTPQNLKENNEFYDIDDQILESESSSTEPSNNASSDKPSVDNTDENSIEGKVEKLQKKLEEQEKLNQKHKDRYLRALADYENLEKRTRVERTRLLKNATGNLLVKLLDFADTIEKAKPSFLDPKNTQHILMEGFLAIEKHFLTILQNEGVEKLDSIGTKFDPNFHEVVSVRKDSGKEDDEILEEIQAGYTLNSSLLRPSKVIIAKK